MELMKYLRKMLDMQKCAPVPGKLILVQIPNNNRFPDLSSDIGSLSNVGQILEAPRETFVSPRNYN